VRVALLKLGGALIIHWLASTAFVLRLLARLCGESEQFTCENTAARKSLDGPILTYEYSYIFMPELSNFTAEFFKALSHPLRIRILNALRGSEVGVNELSTRLEVEQATLSQQLAVLRKSNIVAGRKEGQNVYYSVRDAEIFRMLDVAKRIFNNQLVDVRDLLAQLSPNSRK